MSRLSHDIDDDEIRVISSDNKKAEGEPAGGSAPQKPRRGKWRMVPLIASVAVFAVVLFFAIRHDRAEQSKEQPVANSGSVSGEIAVDDDAAPEYSAAAVRGDGHVIYNDTVVNGVPLAIFRPVNATPRLAVGADVLNDSNAVLAVQAADIRRDNGNIVGAFVLQGELLSKGQAKAGYCAIIGGNLSIGVADATPLFEQAIENEGYFFRQYPLVVAGQIVENKPKGKSLRRALAELNGHIVVIFSRQDMTFHDFSQALVDLGVTNAIYLVGSSTRGIAVDSRGRRITFGTFTPSGDAINYLLWQ